MMEPFIPKDLLKRRMAHKRIDEVDTPSARKGRRAEWTAWAHIKTLGGSVDINMNVIGPDLVWVRDGFRKTVEVKSAIRGPRYWYVTAVRKNRRRDDYVAIVLPDNRVVLEPMSEHLANCAPCGTRSVTKLVRSCQ